MVSSELILRFAMLSQLRREKLLQDNRHLFGALLVSLAVASESVSEPLDRADFDNGQATLRNGGQDCVSVKANDYRLRLIQTAVKEWARFGFHALDLSKPGRPDVLPPFDPPNLPTPNENGGPELMARIAGYWAVVPSGHYTISKQNSLWALHPDEGWQQHWSAAFTSWLTCESGMDRTQFKRSGSHWNYVEYAKHAPNSAFRFETASQFIGNEGDLACLDRRDSTHPHGLHCFLIVRKTSQNAYLIGGNVPDWRQSPAPMYGGLALIAVGVDPSGFLRRIDLPGNESIVWFCGLALKENSHFEVDQFGLDESITSRLDRFQ
ncbi:DUF2272 domain-containing protein [Mesorhizobium australicum]|uniref:DUF2272 domain-containing protein n=1 Tax=Mesorhizobium australicum TaxID=536018 RepID=UPI00333D8427